MDTPDKSESIKDNKLTIKIDGPSFPFDKFTEALKNFESILKEIDKETSGDGRPTVSWSIDSLRSGSLVLTAQGQPSKADVEFDRAFEIVDYFANGLESLRRNQDRPEGFSKAALKHTKNLARLIDPDDFAELDFSARGWKFQQMHEVADNLLQEPHKNYKSWGAISGKMISLNNENKVRFGIRTKTQNRVINCFINDEELFKIALEAIEKRYQVYVYGEIRQIWNGRKVNIKAQEIKYLKQDLSSSQDLLEQMRAIKRPNK